MQIPLQIDEHQREQHHVHAVEHPPKRSRQEGALLRCGCAGEPLHRLHPYSFQLVTYGRAGLGIWMPFLREKLAFCWRAITSPLLNISSSGTTVIRYLRQAESQAPTTHRQW